ncbi:hypothetical protein L3Q82_013533, partial [Scortum barcoo]
MQRISGLAACRELGGLVASSARGGAWKRGPTCRGRPAVHRRWAGMCALPLSGEQERRLCRRRLVFAGHTHRLLSSQPAISVVGIPDPITWIRCKVIIYLIDLYFQLDINSEEFDRGIKQALVQVSNMMSTGRYHRLVGQVGLVSNEMIEYIEKRCKSLTDAQRRKLAVTMDDIVFTLPEDVSVVFDQYGEFRAVGLHTLRRKFCFVVMRFWLLSAHEGPDDPEGTKIFKVASNEDGGPQKKIVTAVF